ncbi:hypothetical protein [Burkholderia pseudomallei]|uniref:hypothetical protein n=1 Tax=Burkholderia pseudomallei TaxID=28450 RepID=UPI000173678E|nr:hypothetical protein [Burkholderia pseudomallei]AUG19832.1 hypothetical protein CXQ84_03440 [Burkholderia pseudomallei]EDU08166.1 hypothetical protein BURPS1655_E0306 [Burkholderia pseudomallei 1655]MBD2919264.1 hypothetical protein [Burkholderia pseudomallei]MBD2997230.1 hypothetical protein [Burkholderia pseudomallei]MBF3753653.1 hypothetical protein [Burkholderia pseudomallei]
MRKGPRIKTNGAPQGARAVRRGRSGGGTGRARAIRSIRHWPSSCVRASGCTFPRGSQRAGPPAGCAALRMSRAGDDAGTAIGNRKCPRSTHYM